MNSWLLLIKCLIALAAKKISAQECVPDSYRKNIVGSRWNQNQDRIRIKSIRIRDTVYRHRYLPVLCIRTEEKSWSNSCWANVAVAVSWSGYGTLLESIAYPYRYTTINRYRHSSARVWVKYRYRCWVSSISNQCCSRYTHTAPTAPAPTP